MTDQPFYISWLQETEKKMLKRCLRPVTPVSARKCVVDSIDCLNFSSNNYLGLADHPYLKEKFIEWTEKYGTGSGASRLVTGSLESFMEVEQQIAEWKGKESALIIGSGYMANIGTIAAITSRKSVIFSDRLNHASIIAGCQLSDAKFVRYRHNDIDHLNNLLEQHKEVERKLIVSDTIFSMDGDQALIDDLEKSSEKFQAMLYLDDAHATGVFGKFGEGLTDRNINSDISMGTFSKAMGSYGAYVACNNKMKEYLINRCGSFIYTTAMPPGIYGAISAAIELVKSDEYRSIREKLLNTAGELVSALQDLGFNTGNTTTPIIPVIFEHTDTDIVLKISDLLLQKGILAVAIRPPTVPKGTSRIRLSINSAHREEDIVYLIDCFKSIRKFLS